MAALTPAAVESIAQDAAPRLAMADIGKAFHGVVALDHVSFDCRAGEVHAICGENGAGKSTLMKILGGIYRPDSGLVAIDGRKIAFSHPIEARKAGISIIHQELSLLAYRSVAENIFLGQEQRRFGVVDRQAMNAAAAKILGRLGSRIPPSAEVGRLAISDQQIVEIAKALAIDARILVLDEPTAALDDVEAARLLDLVRRLRSEGVALVYISHRMKEVFEIADRITVLKDGCKVRTAARAEVQVGDVVRMMVGRDLSDFFPPRPSAPVGPVLLRIAGAGNDFVSDIDLTLSAGEIVGVAGLEGSGKSALARAVFGDEPFSRGVMEFAGTTTMLHSPRRAVATGLGYLSDDRKREGLALQQTLRDNAALTLRAFAAALARPNAGGCTPGLIEQGLRDVDVRAASFDQSVIELSGGNQQKVIVARWLRRAPRVLIAVEPTRGIDVAAKASVYQILRDFTAKGGAVLMISSDLPEIVGLSDRILVMAAGRIVAELPAGAGEEEVMAQAVGSLGTHHEDPRAAGTVP
jgi:ribose transport system ATP-binding protein